MSRKALRIHEIAPILGGVQVSHLSHPNGVLRTAMEYGRQVGVRLIVGIWPSLLSVTYLPPKKRPSSPRAARAAKRRAIGAAPSVILQNDTGLALRGGAAGDGRGVVLRDGEAKATLRARALDRESETRHGLPAYLLLFKLQMHVILAWSVGYAHGPARRGRAFLLYGSGLQGCERM